ncbi:hypothetical protein D1007_17766 [Hordeum vulgare]|nr:hypothetical protein D1007_17766 [Hordeum vulgare]
MSLSSPHAQRLVVVTSFVFNAGVKSTSMATSIVRPVVESALVFSAAWRRPSRWRQRPAVPLPLASVAGGRLCDGCVLQPQPTNILDVQSISRVVFGGYRYNLGFVHIIRIRMFQPDKYSGLDEYYEQKHRAVLVERGEKVANRCRTLAALLSCHGVSSTDVRAHAQYTMDVQSSARPSSSRPRASSARPSSSRAHASSSRAHVEEIEEEEESDNEAADPDFIEFGASQMEDAPQPSQPTQPTDETRRASSRNVRRRGWQNTPEGYVTKGKMAAKRGRK